MAKKVRVEIWSDFVCPWCWIAKRRLDRAMESLVGAVEVDVAYKAYRIARGLPPTAFKEALQKKLGSARAADQMMDAIADSARGEGLVYNFDTMRFGDTTEIHAFVKSVTSRAHGDALIEALMKASITDGEDIFDSDVRQEIARRVGIGELELAARRPGPSIIERDELEASQIARGVPLFVFDSRSHLSGAQPVEAFQFALTQAAASKGAQGASAPVGTCDSEGCGI